ncbi:saccharopine dehydrogenase NADP-binding domain-containing protein [Candidatus Woesearchaeota archaeon]|nr:saccharopine dehydrogenase NADP-binding domain-containing protein [Candidatus Woesearchaeota archaeon]
MNVILLGCGAQGKAALFDILKNKSIKNVTVVENNSDSVADFIRTLDDLRIDLRSADANDAQELLELFTGADIIIDLLPTIFRKHIADIAIEAGVNLVNTSFQNHVESCHNQAVSKNVLIMPESGLDPGIDLILAGKGLRDFDEVDSFSSSCGGFPVWEACDNPLNYKVSWIFEGVLSSYKRPGDLIIDSRVVDIPGDKIFEHSKEISVKGVGKLDMYPNGRASTYARLLGIEGVKNMGRYTLRWPGHAAFWNKMVLLGLLDDDPILGISPRQYIAKVLEPRLQYKDGEQDMVVLRNEISGIKDGKPKRLVQQLIDRRDLKTGFMAMNRTVGFTASIIAQMVLDGRISGKGVMNPGKDIPYDDFIQELKKRDIFVEEWFE